MNRSFFMKAGIFFLSFGILIGLALAGMMTDCSGQHVPTDAGCVCQ
jgi:hypothetical protein